MIYWTLKLLGDCQLFARDGTVVRLPTRKAAVLLAYLGAHPRRSASRQILSDLLWEDMDPTQGRLHVRKALWLIRTAAEKVQPGAPSPVEAEGDQVRLSSSVEVDAAQFLAAVDAAGGEADALQAATALYGGEFLGDMHLRQAPAVAEWGAGQRERLSGVAAAASLKLGEVLSRTPDRLPAAEDAVRKALALDPLQEHGHRLLMEILSRQGRTSAAAQQYREVRALLERELDVAPEPATEELHHRLLRERTLGGGKAVQPDPQPSEGQYERVEAPARRSPILAAVGAMALVIAMSGTALHLRAAQNDTAPKIKRIFPVVTGLHAVGEPTVSPDGSRLVFVARKPGAPQKLYLMTLGGSEPLALTSGAGDDDHPAWSPDGSSIAFTRATGGRTTIMVKTVGKDEERVVAPLQGVAGSVLAWSEDRSALFAADAEVPGRTTAIVRIRLQDGGRTVLTNPPQDVAGDRQPLAVAGNKLVFLRAWSRAASEIMELDLDSKAVRQLTSDHASIADVAVGPGQGELLFSSDRGGDAGLWSIRGDGGPPSRVSEGLLRYHEISSSSSGKRLLFEGIRDRSSLSMLAPGARREDVTENDFREWFPALAGDGAIAFVSTRTGGQQLWLKRAEGEPAPLTKLSRWQIHDPRWSPNGTAIAFVGSGPHRTELFVVERDGGALTRLTMDGSEKRSPVWSPDGRSVYFVRRQAGQQRVWRVAARAGAEPRPVSLPGPTDIRIDPGGRWIYFLLPGRAAIFRQSIAPDGTMFGSIQRVVTTELRPPFSWEIGNGAVYLLAGGQLQRVEVATGRMQPLASASGLHARSPFTIGPKGTVLLNRQDLKVELYGIDFEGD
ncbi:BTAD domain-containing putative transcriptional regulator [Sphingomonas arenae]|uniref:BTAD domain-containing putative transcriptional regulator n=1 Tax=Sphingomonas arenae TaxID=2812555 RepID=UPI001967D8AA|nr:BTAD domain-containing putative transcriptional regulator [Sphingomonas arenae]